MAPPLYRKPLVTTSALAAPINVVGGASHRASMSPSPPAYQGVPPAPSTMLGMPSAIDEATLASSPVDFDKTRMKGRQEARKHETMVLAPHTRPAPVPATVSMAPPIPATVSMAPPIPRTVVSGPMPQASMAPPLPTGAQPARQVSYSSISAVPVRSLPPPHASPAPFAAAQQAHAHQSWSSAPAIRSTTQDPPSGSPLTYQVFDPAAAPAARSGMTSRASLPYERSSPKASLGLRVCLVLLGVCVVLGTAGAVIIGASEDPPHSAKTSPSASAAAGTAAAAVPFPPALPIAPAPVVLPDPPPVAITAPTTTPTTKLGAPAKPKPAGAPPALKGAEVPPNPFAGGPLPVKRK